MLLLQVSGRHQLRARTGSPRLGRMCVHASGACEPAESTPAEIRGSATRRVRGGDGAVLLTVLIALRLQACGSCVLCRAFFALPRFHLTVLACACRLDAVRSGAVPNRAIFREGSPYGLEWQNKVAFCAIMKDETAQNVVEWLEYHRCCRFDHCCSGSKSSGRSRHSLFD